MTFVDVHTSPIVPYCTNVVLVANSTVQQGTILARVFIQENNVGGCNVRALRRRRGEGGGGGDDDDDDGDMMRMMMI